MKNPTTAPDLDALLEHGGWVRALARSLVRDPDLADDVEQQTWLTAMQHPPSHGKNLRAWLGTVVRSVAGTHWRADKARQRRESVVGERQVAREVQKASSAQPDSLAERMDTFRQLAGAMSELEEPYGTTLYLRFFEELPVREVARRMEVPEGTAQTRITRGLKMLRARMATSLGPEWRQRCLVFTLPLAKASWLVPAAVIAMTMKTKLFLGAACVALLSLFLWQPWAAGAPESLPDADGLQAAVLEHHKMKPAVVVEEEPVIARAELPTGEDPVGSAAPAGGEQQLVVRVRDAITLEAVADAEILYYDYSEREQEWSDASRWELLDEEELLDRFGTRAVTDAHGVFRTPLPPEKAVMGARVDGKFAYHFLHPDFHDVGDEVELLLREARSQEVLVVDEQGDPVEGITVGFAAEPTRMVGFARRKRTTDTEGRVMFRHLELHLREDLQNWSNTIAVLMPMSDPQVEDLRNEEIGQETIRFVVPRTGTVEVTCLKEDGTPLHNGIPVTLQVRTDEGEFTPSLTLGKQVGYVRDGVATFPMVGVGTELTAGTYFQGGHRYITASGFAPDHAGETTRLELTMPAPAPKLRLHLTGFQGQPVEEGWKMVMFDYLDPATGETSGIGANGYLGPDGWMEVDAGMALEKDAPMTRVTIDAKSGSSIPIGSAAFAAFDLDVPRFRETKEPMEVEFGADTIVAGRVVDEDGTPVAGHKMILRLRDRRIPQGEMGSLLNYQELRTDEDGSFEFRGPVDHPVFFSTLHLPDPLDRGWGLEETTPFREGQEDLEIVVSAKRKVVGRILLDDMEWSRDLVAYAKIPVSPGGYFSMLPLPLESPNGRFVMENLEVEGLTLELRQRKGSIVLASWTLTEESLQEKDGKTVLPDWDVRGSLHPHRIRVEAANGSDLRDIHASSPAGSVRWDDLEDGHALLFATTTVLDLEVWAAGFRSVKTLSNGEAEVILSRGIPTRFRLPEDVQLPEGTIWGFHLYPAQEVSSRRSVDTAVLQHGEGEFRIYFPFDGPWVMSMNLMKDEAIEAPDTLGFVNQPVHLGAESGWFELEVQDRSDLQVFTIPVTREALGAARAEAEKE